MSRIVSEIERPDGRRCPSCGSRYASLASACNVCRLHYRARKDSVLLTATRINGEAGGAGSFEMPSASTPGRLWTVVYQPGTGHWCGCPRFQRAGGCRHVSAAVEAVRVEAEAVRAALTPQQREAGRQRMAEISALFRAIGGNHDGR